MSNSRRLVELLHLLNLQTFLSSNPHLRYTAHWPITTIHTETVSTSYFSHTLSHLPFITECQCNAITQ